MITKTIKTGYHLHAIGRTWGGFKAEYDYPLTEESAKAMTMDKAKVTAGDFMTLFKASVVCEKVETTAREWCL